MEKEEIKEEFKEIFRVMRKSKISDLNAMASLLYVFSPNRKFVTARNILYTGGTSVIIDEKNVTKRYIEKILVKRGKNGQCGIRHYFEPVDKVGQVLFNNISFNPETKEGVFSSSKNKGKKINFSYKGGIAKLNKNALVEKRGR